MLPYVHISMSLVEFQQISDLFRSEQSKTEKLQGFLEHAEKDVEEMTNQLDEQKALVSTLEQEKAGLSRQLTGAKNGMSNPII